jgi:hypothetical protein
VSVFVEFLVMEFLVVQAAQVFAVVHASAAAVGRAGGSPFVFGA